MIDEKLETPRFSKLNSVADQTGLGKSTLLAWEATGRFPQAVRLSRTIRVWLQKDVDDWVRDKHSQHTGLNVAQPDFPTGSASAAPKTLVKFKHKG